MPWIPNEPPDVLNDLDDVAIPSAVQGDMIYHDGSDWVKVTGSKVEGSAPVYQSNGSVAWDTVSTGGGGGGGGAYAETIGDNSSTSYPVVHSLDTTDVLVQLWDVTGSDPVLATGDASGIEVTDSDTITVSFAVAPAVDSYRVVILASGGSGSGGGGNMGPGSGAVVVDSVSTDGSSPLSVTIPAGVQAGDLVIAAVSTTNSIPNVAGITGFTELLRFDTSSNEWQAIYAKVADGTDESNAGSGTWSITHSSGSEAVLAVGVWRGVNSMWSTQWAIDQLQTPWVPAHPEGLMVLIYMDLNGSAFVMPTFGGDAALTEVVHHRRASGNNNQIWMGSRDTFSPMDGMPHAITGSVAAGFSLAWVGIFYDS